ncbi:MAG TPA: DUF488 family protein [Balneolales bacterium]|nr:DUF488 family protein [Balneolales bacterium]
MDAHPIQTKHIYEAFSKNDGYRVLIDGVWPRGISKEDARLDEWLKEIAPSAELRKWFGHNPDKFGEFRRRYIWELEEKGDLLRNLVERSTMQKVTLLYGAKDEKHNQAVILKELFEKIRST